MQSESNDQLMQVTFHDVIGLIIHIKSLHTNRIDVTKHKIWLTTYLIQISMKLSQLTSIIIAYTNTMHR